MKVSKIPVPGLECLGALHSESLDTIAAVNHWRCSGFPLYGQDLVKSLTITHSIRPVQSRYRGQGYISCLNTGHSTTVEEVDRWKYSTMTLDRMCGVASTLVETLVASVPPKARTIGDSKMVAFYKLLRGELRLAKKVVITTSFEQVVDRVQEVATQCGVRYVVVRGTDSHTTRLSVVARWRLEPRLCILILAGVESQAGLELGTADSVVVLDSGPGLWEPDTQAPLYRLVVESTVEEGLLRIGTVRRILQDVDSSTMDTVTLSKQTMQEVFSPQPDNGYLWHNNTKKKEKQGITDTECVASLNTVWSYVGGGSGVNSLNTLVDLAELETGGEEVLEGADTETVLLRQWLETIAPVTRYGMNLLRDCFEARTGLARLGEVLVSEDQKKMEWERKLMLAEVVEEEDTLANLVTYQSDLVSREWRSADGVSGGVYNPPGLCDDSVCESVCGGYSKATLPESELPPVHVKDKKKGVVSVGGVGGVQCPALSPPTTQLSPSIQGDIKPKVRRDDLLASAPRSLFDRPKALKAPPRRPPGVPGTPFPPAVPPPALAPAPAPPKPPLYREADAGPEWTIQEDWALHQAVTAVQELPLSLTATSPGHISNWDMVADMVNAVSRCFRSGKQCRARYESTVVPREEGRIMSEVTPTKKAKKAAKLGVKLDKKTGALVPARQALKTGALFKTDNNNAFSGMFSSRFETIKSIANKRTPTTTPLLVNPTMRNPKHAAVLAESGINYDNPLSPVQVAANRAERIQRDKARTAQLPTQPTPPTPTTQPSLPQSPVPQAQGTARAVSAVSVSTPIALPTVPTQAVVVGISQPLPHTQQQPTLQNSVSGTPTRPAIQQTVTALSVQEILNKNTVVTTIVSATPTMFTTSTARLPAGQIVMTQAGKTVTASSTVQVGNRQLTPQQLQALKQQTILKKNQQEQQNQIKQRLAMSSTAGGVASSSKVTMATTMQGQGLARGQMIRQNVRSMTEPEIKALLAKQQLKVGQGGVVTVPANTMSAAQLQQLGIQVAGSNPSTTASMVKTVTAPVMQISGQAGTSKAVTIAGVPGVNLQAGQLKAVAGRGTAIKGSPQQIQQLQLQRQLQLITQQKGGLQGQRVALSSGKGLPAQLIVQGGGAGKGLPTTVTVQQLQQIVKSGLGGQGQVLGQGQQIISHVVQAKPGQAQTVQARVIPVSGGGRQGQTIQVVQAAPGQRTAPSVTMNQLAGRPTHTDLATALAQGSNVKIHAPTGASSQQILSQVSAALAGHGQNVSVAVRTPALSSPLPPGATVVQQGGQGGLSRIGGQQMVNLQLSVAGQAQPHTTHTISSSQSSNTE
jgi:E1A-binding protein p400